MLTSLHARVLGCGLLIRSGRTFPVARQQEQARDRDFDLYGEGLVRNDRAASLTGRDDAAGAQQGRPKHTLRSSERSNESLEPATLGGGMVCARAKSEIPAVAYTKRTHG